MKIFEVIKKDLDNVSELMLVDIIEQYGQLGVKHLYEASNIDFDSFKHHVYSFSDLKLTKQDIDKQFYPVSFVVMPGDKPIIFVAKFPNNVTLTDIDNNGMRFNSGTSSRFFPNSNDAVVSVILPSKSDYDKLLNWIVLKFPFTVRTKLL
jgi:hypothetical protein